jgi:hypothetical protein
MDGEIGRELIADMRSFFRVISSEIVDETVHRHRGPLPDTRCRYVRATGEAHGFVSTAIRPAADSRSLRPAMWASATRLGRRSPAPTPGPAAI